MITSELHDSVGLITLDRHERRNALDLHHCRTLHKEVEALVDAQARALVITGAGSTFCAGADLDGVYGDEFRTALYQFLHGLATTPIPVIAAVNGPAVGAGTQLAIACDLRVATPTAFFSVPTGKNGLAVDPWTVQRLALLGGGGTARGLLLGCDRLDATLAYQRGLVDRLGEFDAAWAWAQEIAEMAPLSLRYAKQALTRLFESTEGDSSVASDFEACWASDDVVEGRRARAENRKPQFRGR
jgi:enoyl-CoA hydratase